MKHDRRDFIKFALTAAFLPSCMEKLSPFEQTYQETYFTGFKNATGEYGIKILSETGTATQYLQSLIHSIVYSEKYDTRVYIPKTGIRSYYQKGDGPAQPFLTSDGAYFYGHGVFDEKRELFYTTQTTSTSIEDKVQKSIKGEIFIHSLKDFSVIGKFPSFGFNPHDLTIDNDELIVCNGGNDSNIAYINLDNHSLIKSHTLPDAPHEILAHLSPLENGEYIVAGATREARRPCYVYSLSRDKGLVRFHVPTAVFDLMSNQILSAVAYKDHVYGTCPSSGYLFVWGRDGRFIGAHPYNNASSLAPSQRWDPLESTCRHASLSIL